MLANNLMTDYQNYRGIIFDLDGTLLDTLDDIANAANATLSRNGFPEHPIEAYNYFVGDGVQTLIERILPEGNKTESTIRTCLGTMREEYINHLNVKTKPYEGILALLKELQGLGFRLSVLSNKPHELTVECVHHYFGKASFSPIVGQKPNVPKKPDPSAANQIVKDWNLKPSEVFYMGDTSTDMKTAKAAGLYPIGVTWGFRTEQELLDHGAQMIINHPLEFSAAIRKS
jgi:phosphoglycolate phosphatase